MLTDRRISFKAGRTVQIKDFTSERVDYAEEGTVPEGVDVEEARQQLIADVNKVVNDEVEKILSKKVGLPRGKITVEEEENYG
jgi:hypothetical protein